MQNHCIRCGTWNTSAEEWFYDISLKAMKSATSLDHFPVVEGGGIHYLPFWQMLQNRVRENNDIKTHCAKTVCKLILEGSRPCLILMAAKKLANQRLLASFLSQ